MLICTTTLILVMSLSLFRRVSGFRPSFRPMCGRFRGVGLSTKLTSDWPVERVRSEFVDYFVTQQGHVNYKSSPCVPVNDPTLLFANAGMNQFKSIFVGTVDPSSPLSSLVRAVNSQKCIRAGGKHNDLDDVGKDTYHHTFFEMLGTWSFGNYFKKEAIEWAYDILVNRYKLNPERLYASYFGGDAALGLPCDTEARDMWLKFLPAERVLPFDKKANFWEMGDTGPCGPCSEIHYDRIGGRDAASLVNADDPDVIEIWNLVFIQFNREPSGELRPLPHKHIDTGMGLERLTSILQDKRSNYDTDVFVPLFAAIERIVGCTPYTGKLGEEDAAQNFRDTAYRVIADHVRTLSFAIADGAVPSSDGRGYVLRRILRRAVRYGVQTLGAKPGFFAELVPILVEHMQVAYPELREKESQIVAIVSEEETAFSALLQRGVKFFNEHVAELKASGQNVVTGERAFFMYDTLGFPLDLTQIMAAENGVSVDVEGFHAAMHEQKERSRLAARSKRLSGRVELTLGAEQTAHLHQALVPVTNDSAKYTWDVDLRTEVKALFTADGFVDRVAGAEVETIGVVLADTSFYAESGGQESDVGTLTVTNADGTVIELDVLDVQVYGGYVLHTCAALQESQSLQGLSVNSLVSAQVNYQRRRQTAPNHTMTHVLNFVLREVLGVTVDQKGSAVTFEKLRFDFGLNRGLKANELDRVERQINQIISEGQPVHSQVLPLEQAQKIPGLRAVFGEVYPDPVRVISVGQDAMNGALSSVEFCGGTHISNTKEAQAFVLLEESAIAKGIRRIIGATGHAALSAQELGSQLEQRVAHLHARLQEQQQQKQEEKSAAGSVSLGGKGESLDALVTQLRKEVDTAVVSSVLKARLRNSLESLQKSLYAIKSEALMHKAETEALLLREQLVGLVEQGVSQAVLVVHVGSEARAIKRINDEIKAVAPKLSYLLVSADDTKVSVFAHSQQPDRLRANEWVTAALQDLPGARGGGKANLAQGSATIGMVGNGTSTEETGGLNECDEVAAVKDAVRAISHAANKFTSQLGL